MALRDLFKRKKPKEKKEETPGKKEEKRIKKVPSKKRKIGKLAFRILKEPHITEKATELAKENQYVFKVSPQSNKTEIKKAVEQLYDVDVLKVRILKIPRKRRRLGRISGWKKGYKKAIVRVKKGQKIPELTS